MDEANLFFSYAREDSDFVLKLAKDLRAKGANLWLDQLDIAPGERWDKAIQEALESCETLLVILTPDSVTSQNVMDEVSFALEEKKQVIPVFHTNCEIPFRLKRLQYIDFSSDYAAGLTQLNQALMIKNVPGTHVRSLHQVKQSHDGASPPNKPIDKNSGARPDLQGTPRQDNGSLDAGLRNFYLASIGIIVFIVIAGIAVWMPDWGRSVSHAPPYDNTRNHFIDTNYKWFVIAGSFSKSERPLAEMRIKELQASGYQVSLIDTNQYANLADGLWAVVLGPFESKEFANTELKKIRNSVPDAYVKSGQ